MSSSPTSPKLQGTAGQVDRGKWGNGASVASGRNRLGSGAISFPLGDQSMWGKWQNTASGPHLNAHGNVGPTFMLEGWMLRCVAT